MKRMAAASWQGGADQGRGKVSTVSGVLADIPFDFAARLADGPGTNPEELIAAAHATCFTMALAAQLEEVGLAPLLLHTEAATVFEEVAGSYAVTAVSLRLIARVPGASLADVQRTAQLVKGECPVARLFRLPVLLEVELKDCP